MSAFKYQWNQTIDVGTAGLSKQWTSIRHILSLLVTANACVHVTAYVAVRRSLSTTYTVVVLGLLLRQYVSYQFGVWAPITWPIYLPCTVAQVSYRKFCHFLHASQNDNCKLWLTVSNNIIACRLISEVWLLIYDDVKSTHSGVTETTVYQ